MVLPVMLKVTGLLAQVRVSVTLNTPGFGGAIHALAATMVIK